MIICPKCKYEFFIGNQEKIIKKLQEKGIMSIEELAKEIKVSRTTVYHHLKNNLKKQVKISKRKKGRGNRGSPVDVYLK